MEKEIRGQPCGGRHSPVSLLNPQSHSVHLPDLALDFQKMNPLGHHGVRHGLLCWDGGKYWFEQIARLPVEIDVASELRYLEAPVGARDGGEKS